jgi:3-deoxy-manno-octulosonate cytidylyltransferase (CMP-KDO synthetase)
MSVCIVIPARHDSTRFPGKPLAKINGKEMIKRVYDECVCAVPKQDVYIATDNKQISDVMSNYGARVIMTSHECKTGSDRVAVAVKHLDYDVIIGVQGDEPLVLWRDIEKIIKAKRTYHDCVICGYSRTKQYDTTNTIKVVVGYDNQLIYMSRSNIPSKSKHCKRQVCVYGWYREQLLRVYGIGKTQGDLEVQEDVEILRCMNYDIPIQMVEFQSEYQSVDVPEDIKIVEGIINVRT